MCKPLRMIWFPRRALNAMIAEANRRIPLETGGVLMGYVGRRGSELVITDVIGPGPLARHNRTSFVPDLDFQHSEISTRYIASNRLHTYVGDWHTHPGGGTSLSKKDRNALIEISEFPDALLPQPTMTILAGGKEWSVATWQLFSRRIARIRYRNFVELESRCFDERE